MLQSIFNQYFHLYIWKNELILYSIGLGFLCSPMQAFCCVVSAGQLKGTLKATTRRLMNLRTFFSVVYCVTINLQSIFSFVQFY